MKAGIKSRRAEAGARRSRMSVLPRKSWSAAEDWPPPLPAGNLT